jgi:hypothetical protein
MLKTNSYHRRVNHTKKTLLSVKTLIVQAEWLLQLAVVESTQVKISLFTLRPSQCIQLSSYVKEKFSSSSDRSYQETTERRDIDVHDVHPSKKY